jgi:hypothetical protein
LATTIVMVMVQCSTRPVTMITPKMARVVLTVAGMIGAMWFILMLTAQRSSMTHEIYQKERQVCLLR